MNMALRVDDMFVDSTVLELRAANEQLSRVMEDLVAVVRRRKCSARKDDRVLMVFKTLKAELSKVQGQIMDESLRVEDMFVDSTVLALKEANEQMYRVMADFIAVCRTPD